MISHKTSQVIFYPIMDVRYIVRPCSLTLVQNWSAKIKKYLFIRPTLAANNNQDMVLQGIYYYFHII